MKEYIATVLQSMFTVRRKPVKRYSRSKVRASSVTHTYTHISAYMHLLHKCKKSQHKQRRQLLTSDPPTANSPAVLNPLNSFYEDNRV